MEVIYAGYTLLPPFAARFTLYQDKHAYDQEHHSARLMNLVTTQLHQDSTRESDPLISVLVITEHRLQAGEPESISQDAINWLVDNGHLTLPPEAFK